MTSSAKLYFGFLIWAAGFAAFVAIGKHGADDHWLPYILALIVGCFAYWLGSYFVVEGWRSDPSDLGEELVEHFQYEFDTSSIWINMAAWFSFAIICDVIRGNDLGRVLVAVCSQCLMIAFAVFAGPTQRWKRMKLPIGGFAIHEFGIRMAYCSIKYRDIVSIDHGGTSALRIKLAHRFTSCPNSDLTEQEFDEAVALVKRLIAREQEDELTNEQAELELAV